MRVYLLRDADLKIISHPKTHTNQCWWITADKDAYIIHIDDC